MDSKSIGLCPQGFESPRCRFVGVCGGRFRSRRVVQTTPAGRRVVQMTPAGLEPAIPGSVGRCLIHWATGPLPICKAHCFVAPACVFAACMFVLWSCWSVLRLRCVARRFQCCVRWCVCARHNDTLAEWLRRRPAKPMGSPRVGSNPTGVACLRSLGTWSRRYP